MFKLRITWGWYASALVLGVIATTLTLNYFKLEGPIDPGDGVVHFFLSQASWHNSNLFLDHWGKPLFILLSSPLAQIGFEGMYYFNLLCYIGISLLGIAVLRHLNVSWWLCFWLLLIPLFAHDFTDSIWAGHTEVLFSFLSILALYFFITGRFFWFALVVSFMPFSRSEGQLAILLGLFLLVVARQWKYIPVITIGFLVYSFWGLLEGHGFLWYFTESPYTWQNDIYGKGTWSHYFVSYRNYLGNLGLYTIILTAFSLMYLVITRKLNKSDLMMMIWCYGLFLGIVFAHTIFWALGKNGSMGLTRIATQGMPAALLCNIFVINKSLLNLKDRFWMNSILGLTVVGLLIGFFIEFRDSKSRTLIPLDVMLIRASKSIQADSTFKSSKFLFAHPLIGFSLGANPYITTSKYHQIGANPIDFEWSMQKGDLLFWDSHFCKNEMKFSAQDAKSRKNLELVYEDWAIWQTDTAGVMVFKFMGHEK